MCTVLTKLTKTISVIDVQKLKLCRVETLTRIFIKFRIVPLSSVTLQVRALSGQKNLKRVPHLALLLTLVARPSLADCQRSQHHQKPQTYDGSKSPLLSNRHHWNLDSMLFRGLNHLNLTNCEIVCLRVLMAAVTRNY